MIDRRTFLVSVGASAVLTGLGLRSSGSAGSILKFQGNQSFSFDGLINRAQEMARQPYIVPVGPPNEILDEIDYDARARILGLGQQLRQVVDAYTLLFCVDFMSALGQRFNKEDQPEIDVEKFTRLESIFETLAH